MAIGAFALGAATFACSGETGGATPGEERTVRGFVSVERSLDAGEETRSATSAARFVDAPDNGSAAALLALAGLTEELPRAGECRMAGFNAESAVLNDGVTSDLAETVELLDAGDVSIAADGTQRRLAPHAFPDVSGFVSGVMYTSRDRAEAGLPANVSYTITTSGTAWLPALSLSATAPRDLEQVTVGGVPLAELAQISLKKPMDLTWSVGEAEDQVYAELVTTEATLLCAFRDDAGSGSIAATDLGRLGATETAKLSMHRARIIDYQAAGDVRLRGAELRFDFELTRAVRVGN
jgi:hypothetical protein